MGVPKSILLIVTEENKTRIKDSIVLLTGLKPMEKVTPKKYILKLGIMDPIVIEYDRLQVSRPVKQLRRTALIAMLVKVCERMINIKEFLAWSVNNKVFITKQN